MTLVLYRTRALVQIADMVNWTSLTDKISSSELIVQHYTTSTKLHIAWRHFEKLSEIIPNQRATDLMVIKVEEQNIISSEFPPSFLRKTGDYLSELDAFFYSLRSCIDSFLLQINLIFKLGLSKVYLRDLVNKMNKKYKDKKISKLLRVLEDEPWFNYLKDIRNYLTHRNLSEIATYSEDFRLYLPSDPKTSSYSREKEFEVIPCLRNLYINTKAFLEKGYGLLFDEFGF